MSRRRVRDVVGEKLSMLLLPLLGSLSLLCVRGWLMVWLGLLLLLLFLLDCLLLGFIIRRLWCAVLCIFVACCHSFSGCGWLMVGCCVSVCVCVCAPILFATP